MKLKNVQDFDVSDKLVLLRIDINSPILKGKLLDSPRFKESSDTIKYLSSKGAKVVILAHQGRKGDSDFLENLDQHAKILSKYVGKKIEYCDDLFDDKSFETINTLEKGQVILMKNTRCYEDETDLSKPSRFYPFSEFFELYVNEAFSVSHREQGSIIIPPKVIPSCTGINFNKELEAIDKFKLHKDKQSVYLLGGTKLEDYFVMFDLLKNKNNKILASGVLANSLLASKGYNLGYENIWIQEKGYSKLFPQLKAMCEKYKDQIILPVDFAIGDKDIEKARRKEFTIDQAPFEGKIWDVGPKTVDLFKHHLQEAETVFMKGPLGYSEVQEFSKSTVAILEELSKLTQKHKLFSLLGGGHLTTTIKRHKLKDNFSYVSLSGGALIAYISGQKLPGIVALEK